MLCHIGYLPNLIKRAVHRVKTIRRMPSITQTLTSHPASPDYCDWHPPSPNTSGSTAPSDFEYCYSTHRCVRGGRTGRGNLSNRLIGSCTWRWGRRSRSRRRSSRNSIGNGWGFIMGLVWMEMVGGTCGCPGRGFRIGCGGWFGGGVTCRTSPWRCFRWPLCNLPGNFKKVFIKRFFLAILISRCRYFIQLNQTDLRMDIQYIKRIYNSKQLWGVDTYKRKYFLIQMGNSQK